MTFPCPCVRALIADTIAAVSDPDKAPIVCAAAARRRDADVDFFATTSSGAYLFTKMMSPFPRLITIKRMQNTVVIPTTINKSPVSKFSILLVCS